MNKFWNFTDNDDGSRTLMLCGSIADESWYDDDITPKAFREELNAGKGDVVIWINSPGGDWADDDPQPPDFGHRRL